MSKHAYEKDTPCGRWRVEYERERFLGDTTHDLWVFDKATSKELVNLYIIDPGTVFFSLDYNYLYVWNTYRWDAGGDMYEVPSGTQLLRHGDRWYKTPADKEAGNGVAWPDAHAPLVRLDDFFEGVEGCYIP
jgi:hypothetical protein